ARVRKACDRSLSKAEGPLGSRRVQPLGKPPTAPLRLMRRGFQTVQGRVAPGSERGMARLAAKGLDPFGTAMLAIANQGMNVGIGDPEVHALLVGTSEALGVYSLWCSPPAFDLAPGAYRSSCWPCPQCGSGGETTGGAIVGERGFSRRWSVLRLASPCEEEGRSGNQSRGRSSTRESRRQTMSKSTHMN